MEDIELGKTGTRFSGADWYSEKEYITLIGVGGIGSWVALNLARIGHSLTIIDMDVVDETNVTGGQMFRSTQIAMDKVKAVKATCRDFGCTQEIDVISEPYTSIMGAGDIMICGLDNMKTRRAAFEQWKEHVERHSSRAAKCLFIDGRLTMEMWEVFCIRGDKQRDIDRYTKEHLFTDEEAVILDCSTKQSTFAAMGISEAIVSSLCNCLTNRKLGMEMREVPFYERMYLPLKVHTIDNNELVEAPKETLVVTEQTQTT